MTIILAINHESRREEALALVTSRGLPLQSAKPEAEMISKRENRRKTQAPQGKKILLEILATCYITSHHKMSIMHSSLFSGNGQQFD